MISIFEKELYGIWASVHYIRYIDFFKNSNDFLYNIGVGDVITQFKSASNECLIKILTILSFKSRQKDLNVNV